jgi:hypothetical protein
MTGKPEVITACKQGSDRRRKRPFQNPSRNGTCERLIFQHPSRAILVFQNYLILEGSGIGGVNAILRSHTNLVAFHK